MCDVWSCRRAPVDRNDESVPLRMGGLTTRSPMASVFSGGGFIRYYGIAASSPPGRLRVAPKAAGQTTSCRKDDFGSPVQAQLLSLYDVSVGYSAIFLSVWDDAGRLGTRFYPKTVVGITRMCSDVVVPWLDLDFFY